MKIAWQMVRFFATAALFIFGAIVWRWSLIEWSWEPLIIFVVALFCFAIIDYLVRKFVLKKLDIDDLEDDKKRVISFSMI